MIRNITFLRLPDAATYEDLLASANGAIVPDPHMGPDGRWRGTAVVPPPNPCTVDVHQNLKAGGPCGPGWLSLPYRGMQDSLELRNCPACGSTLAIELDNEPTPALMDAIGDIAEAYQRVIGTGVIQTSDRAELRKLASRLRVWANDLDNAI